MYYLNFPIHSGHEIQVAKFQPAKFMQDVQNEPELDTISMSVLLHTENHQILSFIWLIPTQVAWFMMFWLSQRRVLKSSLLCDLCRAQGEKMLSELHQAALPGML